MILNRMDEPFFFYFLFFWLYCYFLVFVCNNSNLAAISYSVVPCDQTHATLEVTPAFD